MIGKRQVGGFCQPQEVRLWIARGAPPASKEEFPNDAQVLLEVELSALGLEGVKRQQIAWHVPPWDDRWLDNPPNIFDMSNEKRGKVTHGQN